MSSTLVAGGVTAPQRTAFLRDAGRVLRALLRHAEAWQRQRRRAAADREALANMSDRELIDIGIPRGSVHAVAERAWLRDYPC
jgi:uncharacterized protein YjiS (DUF1127 family)